MLGYCFSVAFEDGMEFMREHLMKEIFGECEDVSEIEDAIANWLNNGGEAWIKTKLPEWKAAHAV